MVSEFGQTHPALGIPLIRLSQPARYALEGMAYMAGLHEEKFCSIEEVAKAQQLPKNFLGKIFQRLAAREIVLSQRGLGGGYALAKAPDQVSLWEIVEALTESVPKERECVLEFHRCDGDRFCAIHESVVLADKILREALERTTLADLAK